MTAKADRHHLHQTLLIISWSLKCTRPGRMRTTQNISRLGRTSPTQRWPKGLTLCQSQKKFSSKRNGRFLVLTSNVQRLLFVWLRLRCETVEGEAGNRSHTQTAGWRGTLVLP